MLFNFTIMLLNITIVKFIANNNTTLNQTITKTTKIINSTPSLNTNIIRLIKLN